MANSKFFGRYAWDPYVAFALSRYQTRHNLTDEALSERLGCDSVALSHLSLCLAPRKDHWSEDVAQIAGKFGVNPETLTAMLMEKGAL